MWECLVLYFCVTSTIPGVGVLELSTSIGCCGGGGGGGGGGAIGSGGGGGGGVYRDDCVSSC